MSASADDKVRDERSESGRRKASREARSVRGDLVSCVVGSLESRWRTT
jgi:hypothetical protein